MAETETADPLARFRATGDDFPVSEAPLAMLELRWADDFRTALRYGSISRVKLHDKETLDLHVGDQTLTVQGRNLHRVFEYLTQHRLKALVISKVDPAKPDETVVLGITDPTQDV